MVLYQCDWCRKEECGEAPIFLRGVAGDAGILLPSGLHEKTFCSKLCFWRWALSNAPNIEVPCNGKLNA